MPPRKSSLLNLEDAETLALQVLTFLLADGPRLSRFMALTGTVPADIRTIAETPALQASTLEYLLSDESLLLMFCQEAGVDPVIVAPAHALLVKHSL